MTRALSEVQFRALQWLPMIGWTGDIPASDWMPEVETLRALKAKGLVQFSPGFGWSLTTEGRRMRDDEG